MTVISHPSYADFLQSKRLDFRPSGFDASDIADHLFDFQKKIVRWALQKGRAAIFADCGMGKTAMQLEWARQVVTNGGRTGKVLILAPLAVTAQTVAEAKRFGVNAKYVPDGRRSAPDCDVIVTNYERLESFLPWTGAGVVLDESSILKAYDGKTRTQIINAFAQTPYRLACTATPAPNDYMELGNHAQFLGVMTREEMLASFFVHDGGDTSKWRLKGHAEKEFWKWLCGWAVTVRKPSDLGFEDRGYVLPTLEMHVQEVKTDRALAVELGLTGDTASTLAERRAARKASLKERVQRAVDLVAERPDEPWLLWCNCNDEGDALEDAIAGSVQVAGADSVEVKAERMLGFSSGKFKVLITKPSIAGFGMNWQHCANVAFVGMSDSYEEFYQAVRRCWRFGQQKPVQCHLIIGDAERVVLDNVARKETDADRMAEEMNSVMGKMQDTQATAKQTDEYKTKSASGDGWEMQLGDSVELIKQLPNDCLGYSIFSPPFASLYTYSNSERDMGNCRTHAEFFEHFRFLIGEMYRATMPGRLLSFHCMNLPTSKSRDGVIGITDFRGMLIKAFQEAGWIYHSEVTIWKNPVTAMQRTKALGLLYKQLKKDSAMSRQGIPDYLVTMRKPGTNPEPVAKTPEGFSVDLWQQYASPVWMDINPSKTLQKMREDDDERHICPLQLEVIERAVRLWSVPGDVVFSPFAGIGSEGYVSLQLGRKFVGFELKEAYFDRAEKNLRAAPVGVATELPLDEQRLPGKGQQTEVASTPDETEDEAA